MHCHWPDNQMTHQIHCERDRRLRKIPRDALKDHGDGTWLSDSINRRRLCQSLTMKLPRRSVLAQHTTAVVDFNPHELLPEEWQDRLRWVYVRHHNILLYAGDVLFLLFTRVVLSLIGPITLGYSMTSENHVPEWFPSVGAYFYIVVVPYGSLALLYYMLKEKHRLLADMDLVQVVQITVPYLMLCCIVSPLYGTWTITSLATASEVDSHFGLVIAAYVCCAVSVPNIGYYFFLGTLSIPDMPPKLELLLAAIAFTPLLVSTVHQKIVGQHLWYPHFAVIGWLICFPTLVLIFSLTRKLRQRQEHTFVPWYLVVDVTALFLSNQNLLQESQSLLQGTVFYAGAVMFYVVCFLMALGAYGHGSWNS